MDRAILEQMLAEAEQHVTLGERHIARQHELIAKFERDGHDSRLPKELLTVFLAVQETFIRDCDRLLERLKFRLS